MKTDFVRIWKMCDCGCGCDFLICDFTLLFLGCFLEKVLKKQPRRSATFVIRCIVGLAFDAIEYGILTATEDDIDYDRFKYIFIVYSVFVVFILLTFWCTDKEVFIFIFALFFKCISLSVAISIFTTTSTFEWETIETSFTTIDSERDFFTALLIFVSFADIWLNIGFLILKVGFVCIMTIDSKKGCDCDEFEKLMWRPIERVGVND